LVCVIRPFASAIMTPIGTLSRVADNF